MKYDLGNENKIIDALKLNSSLPGDSNQPKQEQPKQEHKSANGMLNFAQNLTKDAIHLAKQAAKPVQEVAHDVAQDVHHLMP